MLLESMVTREFRLLLYHLFKLGLLTVWSFLHSIGADVILCLACCVLRELIGCAYLSLLMWRLHSSRGLGRFRRKRPPRKPPRRAAWRHLRSGSNRVGPSIYIGKVRKRGRPPRQRLCSYPTRLLLLSHIMVTMWAAKLNFRFMQTFSWYPLEASA